MNPESGAAPSLSAEQPISALGLSARPLNALERLGLGTIGELTAKTRKELSKARGLGASSLTEIEQKLELHGLRLGSGAGTADASPLYARLLQRPLRQSEHALLENAALTSLPGKPGGRVRTLMERTGARTLLEVARLDPGDLRRLPNVGTKTVDALVALLDEWLRAHARPETDEKEATERDRSPVLGRTLTPEEVAAAAEARLFPEGGRTTLLRLLLAEPAAPTEAAAERASHRAEALLLAARFQRSDPSEFFGHILEAAHLIPREAMVMRLRWGIGVPAESLREVGSRFGLSGEWARRLEGAMSERLREHFAGDQIRHYACSVCSRLRWPAARWGLMTEAQLLEGVQATLGGQEHLEALQHLCNRLAGQQLTAMAADVWPRDPARGWFARTEEILRLAQAWVSMEADEEVHPSLRPWQSRVSEVCREEEEEEEAEAGAFTAPSAAPAPPAVPPAPTREVRSPSEELAAEMEEEESREEVPSENRPGERAAARPGSTAREFIADYLQSLGGNALLEEVVAAGTAAGYPANRIENCCRNLPRRFELRDGRVYLL